MPGSLETLIGWIMPFSTPSRRILVAAAVFVLVVSDASMADQPAVVEQSMADFIKSEPDCMEFSDQCSVCAMENGKAVCSTPRIACIKRAYMCTRRRDQ